MIKHIAALSLAGLMLLFTSCGGDDDALQSDAPSRPKTQPQTQSQTQPAPALQPLPKPLPNSAAQARALVERAIAAHGGPAQIAKLHAMRIKVQGEAAFIPGQPPVAFTLEDTWQSPNRYLSKTTFQFQGQTITQTQGLDGDTGWIESNGLMQDMPAAAVAEMKQQKSAEALDHLDFLGKPGIQIALLDPAAITGKSQAGILVTSPAHPEVRLYFDTQTGFLVRREQVIMDQVVGRNVRQDARFSDFKDHGGLQHAMTITARRDGQPFIDAKVIELEFLDEVDPAIFSKP